MIQHGRNNRLLSRPTGVMVPQPAEMDVGVVIENMEFILKVAMYLT